MATLQLIQALQSGLVNPTTGALLASGKCRFYDLSTLTPQTVYSDSAGASPITQPLTLTAGGTGTVYTANPCRCIVKDATDVSTIYDIAAVNGSVPAAQFITSTSFNGGAQTTLQTILDAVDDSFGGTDWKYKHSATATERNLKDWMGETWVSVTDYGAVGDDSTNNLTTIQNAINAAAPGVLYFPEGTFRFTGALTVAAGGLRVVGAGRSATILKQMGTTVHGFDITPTTNGAIVSFSDLAIQTGTVSTGAAIRSLLSGALYTSLRLSGVTISSGWTNAISNSTTSGDIICDDCSLSASADCVLSNAVTRITNSSVTTAGGIAVDSSTAFLSNSSITGSTSAVDTSSLRLSATITSGAIVISDGTQSAYAVGSNTGTVTDARTQSPVAFVLSGTTSVTPLPGQSPITKIVQGGAGATTTINAPAAAVFGTHHTVICSNTSGGALTWTWNAVFKISAAVAPATGNRISVFFYYDAVDATWSEVGRSAAVPN